MEYPNRANEEDGSMKKEARRMGKRFVHATLLRLATIGYDK